MSLAKTIVLLLALFSHLSWAEASLPQSPNDMTDAGIRFSCQPEQLAHIESAMQHYFDSLGISTAMVVKTLRKENGQLLYTLNAPANDTDTLGLKANAIWQIRNERVYLPQPHGKARAVLTVAKKEIVLALLQHGRLTEFKDGACDIQALKNNVGLRQNIVAWAENLNWVWPDGNQAQWHAKFWHRGTPNSGVPLHVAFNDIFFNQSKYAIGCYTATKIVLVQAVLDYYRRIKPDPALLQLLENRLLADQEPLVDIEPGAMWQFETDFEPAKLNRLGKLVKIERGIAARNFVPGDWVFLSNTDPVTAQKLGYEGSNAIYLGRNKFDDYYNDNHHAYTYQQKIDEVFQWRNGVFSRTRDAAKIQPLRAEDIERLGEPPVAGGLVMDIRVSPYLFGYEALPQRQP